PGYHRNNKHIDAPGLHHGKKPIEAQGFHRSKIPIVAPGLHRSKIPNVASGLYHNKKINEAPGLQHNENIIEAPTFHLNEKPVEVTGLDYIEKCNKSVVLNDRKNRHQASTQLKTRKHGVSSGGLSNYYKGSQLWLKPREMSGLVWPPKHGAK
ncbi:unnamed protein product, partial [Allacma fusca]